MCHRFSLLHAIAIAHLRREVQLRKFTTAAVLNRTDEPDKRPIKACSLGISLGVAELVCLVFRLI